MPELPYLLVGIVKLFLLRSRYVNRWQKKEKCRKTHKKYRKEPKTEASGKLLLISVSEHWAKLQIFKVSY